MMRSWKSITSAGLSVVLAGVLSAQPAQTQAGPPQGPPAGMLNYVEGQVSVNGQAVNQQSAGSVSLQAGQTLGTQNGRVEMLLTPGVVVRLDNNSAVMMNNPGIPDTDIAVQGGRVMVEADQVMSANHIDVREGPATIRLAKNGLYDFDAARMMVRVFDGRAEVTVAGKTHTLQGGHEFNLNEQKLHARGFDKKASEDAFYRWSSLRSAYLAEANADAARGFAQGYYGGGPYYGAPYYGAPYYSNAAYGPYPGWFWDPYWGAYTWLPWDGVFFNPFGWGFYSVGFAYAAPFYGFHGGFHGGYHAFGPGFHPSVAPRAGGSALVSGGVHSFGGNGFAHSAAPASGFHGGGFGGGGFHGGGFGGGGRR